jgi:chromosome segregation ATPase
MGGKEQSMEARLAEAGRRIDQVAERAHGAHDEVGSRVGRRVDALRAKEATARAKAREAAEAEAKAWDEVFVELDRELDELDIELAIAEAQLDADLAADQAAFEAAVQRQLDAYHAYVEGLQARAAQAGQTASDKLEATANSVRERRAAVVARLNNYRDASAQGAEALKAGVYQALDDLDRAAEVAWSNYASAGVKKGS